MGELFDDLWKAAQQAGPFASLLLLAALWVQRQEYRDLQKKYDGIVSEFIRLAGDTQATLKDWRDVLGKVLTK